MFVRVGIVLLAAVVLWAMLARDTGATAGATHYSVQPGDTLWSIALAHVGGDPREGVWRIQRANDLEGATIVPGQRLVMP
jgi:nucleoid-associated protein YgaU